jgi:hypothetical protein
LACNAVPGFGGVVLTDTVDDHRVLYPHIFVLSQKSGIEFALTREGSELALWSGAPGSIEIPSKAELLAHTHPYDEGRHPQTLPSRADINTLNARWARRPDLPRPRSDIVWGTAPDHVTTFHATGLDSISDPTKGGLKPRRLR